MVKLAGVLTGGAAGAALGVAGIAAGLALPYRRARPGEERAELRRMGWCGSLVSIVFAGGIAASTLPASPVARSMVLVAAFLGALAAYLAMIVVWMPRTRSSGG
jgi:hypothetical protein